MIGIDFVAAHMVGDYLLQTDRMARFKLTDWRVRVIHVSMYCLPFVLVALWHGGLTLISVLFLSLLWVTHFITDSRRWASGDKWPPKPILIDQTIHLATLALLARLFVW